MSATVIILLSVLLTALLVWKEWQRPKRKHLALRLTASLLAVAAFACMILPVRYHAASTPGKAGEIVVLTPGATKADLSNFSRIPVYTTDPAQASASASYIPDLSWFLTKHPDITSIQVLGYGFQPTELEWLSGQPVQVVYHPAALPEGFVATTWNRQLRSGDVLEVQGTYHNTTKDKVKLLLSGVGTRLDSVDIAADSSQAFSVRCKPSHTGNTLYELAAVYPNNKTIPEKIPVTITPATSVQVLLLSSSPVFENLFLLQWIYDNKTLVAARHTVSKNKYGQQFLNRTAVPLQNITPALLETFDVLVTDDEALASLNATEKVAVQTQVSKGMGLVLQADSTIAFSSFSKSFPVKKQAGAAVNARPLKLAGQAAATTPLLPAQWLYIESGSTDQALVTDDRNAVLVSCHLSGAGKVVLNTVSNTFNWVLSGNRKDYAQFWSLLISKAARQKRQDNFWQQTTDFPVVDNPVQLTLQAAPDEIPVIHTPGGKVYVSQHAWLPDTWTGTWWPMTSGWQTISSGDSTALYIYEPDAWTAAKAGVTIRNNSGFAEKQQKAATATVGTTAPMKQVPLVVFFLAFVVCCGYLWIEAKQT
jgi:hypothetical protein